MRRPSFRETVKCVSSVSTLTTEIGDLDAKVLIPFSYDRQFRIYVNQKKYQSPNFQSTFRKCFPGAFFNLPLTSCVCFVILKYSFIFFRQARGGLYVIHKDAKI